MTKDNLTGVYALGTGLLFMIAAVVGYPKAMDWVGQYRWDPKAVTIRDKSFPTVCIIRDSVLMEIDPKTGNFTVRAMSCDQEQWLSWGGRAQLGAPL